VHAYPAPGSCPAIPSPSGCRHFVACSLAAQFLLERMRCGVSLGPALPLCRSSRSWQGPVLTCLCLLPELVMWCPQQNPMTDRVYTFIKSPEQLRRLGARGGRAYSRNQRARRARLALPHPAVPARAPLYATAAESIAVLDACFPWLRGAEKRLS
jgi:hypothetical protein